VSQTYAFAELLNKSIYIYPSGEDKINTANGIPSRVLAATCRRWIN
jgi:hypothetical protein